MKAISLFLLATLSFSAFPTTTQIQAPGLDGVKIECRHLTYCNDWGFSGKCTTRALVGYETGTGQLVSQIVIESAEESEADVGPVIVRKAIVANLDSSNIQDIKVEPINYGTVFIRMDAMKKEGTVSFMGPITEGTLSSVMEHQNIECELY